MGNSRHSPQRSILLSFFGWVFAILFVISMVGVIFSFFPFRKLLNPAFYKQALEEVHIYQRLPESVAHQLASNFTQRDERTNSSVYLLLLDQREWESILVNLIDPYWLQTQTENILDQLFAILLNSPDPVNTPIEVSLLDVKARIAGPEGTQAFNQILNAQDPCSLDQLMGLLQLGLGMETSIDALLCRPPDYVISELNPVVEAFLSALVTQVPDQISFNLPFDQMQSTEVAYSNEINRADIPEIIRTLRLTNALITWSPLLPVGLVLLLTIFVVRSLKDFLLWWGGTLLTAGGISLLLSLILFLSMNWLLGRFLPVSPSGFGLTPLLLELGLVEFSHQLANSLLLSILIPSVIITFIGLIFLLGLYFLRSSSPPAETPFIESTSPASNMDWG